MTRFSFSGVVVAAALALIATAGCRSTQPTAPSSTDATSLFARPEVPDLNDPYGGYNLKDDEPAFGDADLLAEYGEAGDANVDDPFEPGPMDAGARNRLFLMATWGNLDRDPAITHVTEWSGSLKVDPGTLAVRRVLRFEPGDHIVPRTSRDLVEWVSRTSIGIDGIVVRVIPTRDSAGNVDSTATVITFEAGPVKVEFTLAELPGLKRVIELDDGNAVALQGLVAAVDGCPNGFAHGYWRNVPDRPGGAFAGRWVSEVGLVRGYIRGIYGTNDAGEKVLFGKMISLNGRFEGIIRGTWDHHPEDVNGGWFAGRWVDRNLEVRGGIRGEWHRCDINDGGFFRAIWAMDCTVR